MTAIAPEFINRTTRHREIDRLQKYLASKQYEGRPDFFTGRNAKGDEVPLRERKPAIIFPLPRNAVREAVRFTFGEGRFPTVHVKPVEKDAAIGSLGIEPDDAKVLQQCVADIVEQAQLRIQMRQLQEQGLACRTAVAIWCLRDGKFVIDTVRAQDCSATFVRPGDPSSDVATLTICYQFDKEVANDVTGEPQTVRHWFRRDITATHDVRFADVPVVVGKRPEWVEDAEQTVEHKFGFCPVRWIRNLPESHCGSVDGVSLYEDLFEEFDALNFALSQRHRGIAYVGTPQMFETGVADDDGPEAVGRTAGPSGWSGRPGDPVAPFGAKAAIVPARKQSPDEIWSYRGERVQVGLIETTGTAFDVATKHVDDISARLKQSMGVVLANAADVLGKGDMSAKFLALAYAPLLALVDDLRECWWGYGLRPLLEMALRIVMVRAGKGILIPRAEKVAQILKGRTVTTEAGAMWVAPEMSPAWGAYFSPSNQDIKTAVDTAKAAREAKLVGHADAVAYVADDFGVRDVDEAVKAASLPTLEDAALFKAAGCESEELEHEFNERLARAIVPGLDEAEYAKIAKQMHDAAEASAEMAEMIANGDAMGADREEGGQVAAPNGGGGPTGVEAGGVASARGDDRNAPPGRKPGRDASGDPVGAA